MGALDAFLLHHDIDLRNTIREAVIAFMKGKADDWKGNYYDLYIEAFRASHLQWLKLHRSHARIDMLATINAKAKIWALLEPFGIGFAALKQRALVLPTFN